MSVPLVSVIIPSYNHASFIRAAVDSALAQTYKNVEIVITDDGSIDDTRLLLGNMKAPQMRCFFFDKNRGAAAAMNNCVRQAKGEFLAVLNSDDIWLPNKLERQMAEFGAAPEAGAVFSAATFVDEQGRSLDATQHVYQDVFLRSTLTQAELLRSFFFNHNCLCHPSAVIRRKVFDTLGLYDNRLRQLPDFDMWVRVVKMFSIRILDEELVKFRLLDREMNTSSPSRDNSVRSQNELLLIYKRFFAGIAEEIFREAFAREFADTNEVGVELLAIKLLLEAETRATELSRLAGLELLFEALGKEPLRMRLADELGIDDLKYQDYARQVDTLFLSRQNSLGAISTPELVSVTTSRVAKAIQRRLFKFKN